MDLIDRDELELDTEWSDYYDGYMSYSQSQINGESTVNAIPIPDNATNGDMIKAMFPNQTISCVIPITDRNGAKFYRTTINGATDFTEDWWNAPYNKEGEKENKNGNN